MKNPKIKSPGKENSDYYIEGLIDYLRSHIPSKDLRSRIKHIIDHNLSNAGKRHEEVFTRDFLCPNIADYFYSIGTELNLKDEEIKDGLGSEGGPKKVFRFGFAPARKEKHLFLKGDIIKRDYPKEWDGPIDKKLPSYQACPDFAIRDPLPVSVVGEVKYFTGDSRKAAIQELYIGARQAVFYLGAFGGKFKSALLVFVDASDDHIFQKALETLHPELLPRFGKSSGIYLLSLPVI